MAATITQVRAAIAAVLAGVSGIKRIYTTAPNSLPPADLPAVAIYAGPATYAERGFGINDGETRQYLIRLYVKPVQQGIPGEAEVECEPFFAPIRAAFPPGDRLGRLAGSLEAFLTGDQGVGRLPLGGSFYLGVQFTLEVTQ